MDRAGEGGGEGQAVMDHAHRLGQAVGDGERLKAIMDHTHMLGKVRGAAGHYGN